MILKYIFKLFLFFSFTIILAEEGSISGKVTDGNKPLSGANVYLVGTSMGNVTDSLGNYSIRSVPIGKYSLRVDYIGYERSSLELYISGEDISDDNTSGSSFSDKLGIEDQDDDQANIIKGNQLMDINFVLISSSVGLNEVIVSASKKKQKITKAPATISTINNFKIRNQVGVDDYSRLVTNLKGVDVAYYGVQGSKINARGFSGMYNTRFKQFNNGIDMAEQFGSRVYTAMVSPPKEYISKMEVVFGPQSSLYGADASTGLLNIIPKDPRYNQSNEMNFSIQNFGEKNKFRFGSRLAKKISENLAIDISTELHQANELDYGNTEKDADGNYKNPIYYDFLSDPLTGETAQYTLEEDWYGVMEQKKIYVISNIVYTLNNAVLRVTPQYLDGSGLAVGSLGPIYNKKYDNLSLDIVFSTNNHTLRYYFLDQGTLERFRTTLAQYQAANGKSFEEALEDVPFLDYNGNINLFDYQYRNIFAIGNREIDFTTGFEYEHLAPRSGRSVYADSGYDVFLDSVVSSPDINEFKWGSYVQMGTDLVNDYSITGSLRYDFHEFFDPVVSPKIGLVKENFYNGSLKIMYGKGFKAASLLDRWIYTAIPNYSRGSLAFLGESYADSVYSLDLMGVGNMDGFTLNNFMDNNGNGIYDNGDELLKTKSIDPLKLEMTTTSEIAYVGMINKNTIFEFSAYASQYENFKTAATNIATVGPGYFSLNPLGPFSTEVSSSHVEVLYGDQRVKDNTILLTFYSLPVKVNIWGIETGIRYFSDKYSFDINYSYLNDEDLIEKREKADSFAGGDSSLASFSDFRTIYTNAANHQLNLSGRAFDILTKDLSVGFQLRYTSEFNFKSGWYQATDAGSSDNPVPYRSSGGSFFRDKGPVGGGVFLNFDMRYQLNNNVSLGIAMKNVLESKAITFPLSPEIPRSIAFDIGYNF